MKSFLRNFSSKVSTIELVSRLRKQTDLGILKCKEALSKNDNDYERALDWIRSNLVCIGEKNASSEKFNDRAKNETLIAFYQNSEDDITCMLQAKCETDFVARGSHFINLLSSAVASLSACVSEGSEKERLNELLSTRIPYLPQKTVKDSLLEAIAVTGESMSLEHAIKIQHSLRHKSEFAAHYLHPISDVYVDLKSSTNSFQKRIKIGSMGCILFFHGSNNHNNQRIGTQISMQLCALLKNSNSESEFIGRIEPEILDQPFLFDQSKRICDLLAENSIQLKNYIRLGKVIK